MRDASAIVALLASDDEEVVRDAERALLRLEGKELRALTEAFEASRPPLRARVCKAIGRLAPESEDARAFVLRALRDEDAKTRRNAILALGKVRAESRVEDALLAEWERETRVDHRRSIAGSLGKVGSLRALAALRAMTPSDDGELTRIVGRAALMLERSDVRERPETRAGGIDASRAPSLPAALIVHCRAGLEKLVEADLGAKFDARTSGEGVVRAMLHTPLSDLFACRTMASFGFALAPERIGDGEDVGAAVVRAVTSDVARRIFETWTVGPIRYRIAWSAGGHRRAVVWRIAQDIARTRPELVNDPKETTWEAIVSERGKVVEVELAPRALPDPRFAYRVEDVPAASHPPLAAALVRIGGILASDVVWDPFCGSATELVERALAGPYARLVGSDGDPRALVAARANAAAAHVENIDFELGDATSFSPDNRAGRVTLIVTNPPMGRRIGTRANMGALVDRFIDHAVRVLVPEGRLAWVSPIGERSRARAESKGMRVELDERVDMGGFSAQMQLIRKGKAR